MTNEFPHHEQSALGALSGSRADADGPHLGPMDDRARHRVRIREGLFAGVEGSLLTRPSGARTLIALCLPEGGVSMEIDSALVEELE